MLKNNILPGVTVSDFGTKAFKFETHPDFITKSESERRFEIESAASFHQKTSNSKVFSGRHTLN